MLWLELDMQSRCRNYKAVLCCDLFQQEPLCHDQLRTPDMTTTDGFMRTAGKCIVCGCMIASPQQPLIAPLSQSIASKLYLRIRLFEESNEGCTLSDYKFEGSECTSSHLIADNFAVLPCFSGLCFT